MKRSLGAALLLSILYAHTTFAASKAIYHAVACNNGFQNAYYVSVVDESTGCLLSYYGVDCAGKTYSGRCTRLPVDGDPNWPYTFVDVGTTLGWIPYTLKTVLTGGSVSRIWGEDANGYYIAELTPL